MTKGVFGLDDPHPQIAIFSNKATDMSRIIVPNRMGAILAARQAPAIVHMSAYANTLTSIIPTIYTAMDVVSRELQGFIPSAMRAPGVERAAVGQSVPYPIAPVQVASDVVPSMSVPEPPDNTITTGNMAITKARKVPWGFTGEEQKALNSGGSMGPGYLSAQGMIIAQAFRTLTNEIEADLSAEAAANASRAYGTAGTTPFGSGDLTDMAQIKKILDDNGAPRSGRSMILNTSASARMIALNNLARVNEAGTQLTLRQGELLDIFGFSVKETGFPVSHVTSTAAGATTNAAGYAVGATLITLAVAGTGNITAGEVVTFAGDTNKYVVVTGDADVSNGGTFTISEPGLRVAIPAAATAITKSGTYTASVGFSMDALHVAMRPPARPSEGDLALDVMLVTDPRSGITFEMAVYPGYRKVEAELSLAWGVKATKRAHIALLLG